MEVVINAAMSADGKLSTAERRQVPISGEDDLARVDELRAEVDAVMVGVGTVLADDPRLTVKDEAFHTQRSNAGRSRQPIRVVADSRARTPANAAMFEEQGRIIVLVSDRAPDDRVERLEERATIHRVGEDRVDMAAGLDALEEIGVTMLMVEGGGEVIYSLFATGRVDRLRTFVGGHIIGGRDAPTLVDGPGFTKQSAFVDLSLRRVERLDGGIVLEWIVNESA